MLKEILTATNNTTVDTANETVKFEVGKTYYAADFAGEWSEDAPVIVKTLNVIKRTAKTLTAIDENGNQVLKRISLAYAGTKETVVVSSVNDITAQTVHIYSDKEYTPAIAAAPTAHFNAWGEAINNTKAETYTPQSTWEDPHNYTTAGNLTGTPRSYNFDADNYANVILAATVEEYAVTTAAFDGAILCEMHTAKVASGTYNITINGEYVSFKNHSIVRIDATRERQMYLEKGCKGRNRFYAFNPGHGQNNDGAPIDKKKKTTIITTRKGATILAVHSVAMRLKTTVTATGATKTKTISPLAFQTFDGMTDDDKGKAIKVMAQRIVALTTDTYVETDMIVTTNVDTLEVTNLG